MEDKKIKESEKLNGVTGSIEQAAAGETEPKDQGAGGGEEEKGGGDKQMVDVNDDAEDDEEADDDEEMGDEEEGERREAPHASFTTTQVMFQCVENDVYSTQVKYLSSAALRNSNAAIHRKSSDALWTKGEAPACAESYEASIISMRITIASIASIAIVIFVPLTYRRRKCV